MSMDSNIPQGFTLRHTLRGHEAEINRIAWSPDQRLLATPSYDRTIRVWNIQIGQLEQTLIGHEGAVFSLAWSPDGKLLASGSRDKSIRIWDVQSGQALRVYREHTDAINDLAWAPDGSFLASASADFSIHLWQPPTARSLHTLKSHSNEVYSIAWSSDSSALASGSIGGIIRVWHKQEEMGKVKFNPAGTPLRNPTLSDTTNAVHSLAWQPDKNILAAGSRDGTVRLWDMSTSQLLNTFEGHTAPVTGISFSYDGRLLASKSLDGTVRIRLSENGETVALLEESASNGGFAGLSFHPNTSALATLGEKDGVIHIWDLAFATLLESTPVLPSVHYRNAKVVLVGESGVGKTALGQVLTEHEFTPTVSNHGRYVYRFDSQSVDLGNGRLEQRETFLWDLAGQIGYRLIHQLHLAEFAIALIVFSDNQIDPLAAVPHWIRALRAAQSTQSNRILLLKKFLIEARVDRGHAKISSEEKDSFLLRMGLDGYIDTSALGGQNIPSLKEMIKQAIEWDTLPKVTSTEQFQRIKEFLLAQKDTGSILTSIDTLYRSFLRAYNTTEITLGGRKEFDTCIGLIESQGLIRHLSFGGLILLQPELLDIYAAALVNVARDDPDELGSVAEAMILEGNFTMPVEARLLEKEQEKLLLLAMVEDLLRYEVALREQGSDGAYLVFPSEVKLKYNNEPEQHKRTVVFNFEGPVLSIYATLAVRLSHSGFFKKHALWQNAAIYQVMERGVYGIALRNMRELEEGQGELALFFDNATSKETRLQFEEYVKVHLERYASQGSVERKRIFYCPSCQELITDSMAINRRKRGFDWLTCSVCDSRVSLRDEWEQLSSQSEERIEEQTVQIDRTANAQVKQETAKSILKGKMQTRDFDVFLCHNHRDKPEVKKLGEQLKSLGILPWLDEWELRPGLSWQRLLEQQIGQIKSAVVFVGQDGIGPWQHQELDAFLREFVSRRCPVIPVVLSNAPHEPQLPIFLQGMTWVDFRKQDPDPMDMLIWGITGQRPV